MNFREIEYRFGLFTLHPRSGELAREGLVVRLRPQPARLLTLLVERAGALVTREEIITELWPDTKVEFDQGLNSCVRQIRSALGDNADTPTYIETLPRRGYRFIAPVETIESGDDEGRRAAGPRAVAVGSVVAVALLVAATVWAWPDRLTFAVTETLARPTVVVLPFVNLSGDSTLDHFGPGAAEEISTTLQRLPPDHLGVIARTSARAFADSAATIGQVAEALGVRWVVEGTVLSEATGPVLHVRLVRARDQTSVWADSLSLDGSPPSYAPLAAGAATAMGLPATGFADDEPPVRAEVLEGRFFLERGDPRAALARFDRAVRADSSDARAWAGRARAHLTLGATREARADATRAAGLEPDLAAPHEILGSLTLFEDWDWTVSAGHFERALEIAPGDADVMHAYAFHRITAGYDQEAVTLTRRAIELDPVAPRVHNDGGWIFYWAGDYATARAECARALELFPAALPPVMCLLRVSSREGRVAEAAGFARSLLPDSIAAPEEDEEAVSTYWRWREATLAAATEMQPAWYDLAVARAELGRGTDALDALEQAVAARDPSVLYVRAEPAFEPLRGEFRFRAITSRIPFPDA